MDSVIDFCLTLDYKIIYIHCSTKISYIFSLHTHMYLEFNFTGIICHRYRTIISVKLSYYIIIIYQQANCIKIITEQVRYYISTLALYRLLSINENFLKHFIPACNEILLVKQMSSFLVHISILHIHLYYVKSHVSKYHFIHVSQTSCVPVFCTHSQYLSTYMYITAVRVIVIDILHYIAFWLILLVHVHRVTHIHLNEDLLYLEPWFGHYQMTSITKIKTYVSIYMLLVISSWQYMSHISYILNLDVFSVNIILNKMYSTCVITMTITPGDKYKQNKILILVMKYLETFPQPVFISFFEFYLFLRCGWGSALINVTLSTCIILHEIILFTLFLNIILILNSRNIRNLLVVYNDLIVNIRMTALEYLLTLIWYKTIYIYSYQNVYTYTRLFIVGDSIYIRDNISHCTYQKSEICMFILLYTLLQLHVHLYVTVIIPICNNFIDMISNKTPIIKSGMDISEDIVRQNMHKCYVNYVNYVIIYICTCYFCYRFSLMIILSMLTGTVT